VGPLAVVDGSPGGSRTCSVLFSGSTAARLSAQALCSPTELCDLALQLSSHGRHKVDEALDHSQQSFTKQQKGE